MSFDKNDRAFLQVCVDNIDQDEGEPLERIANYILHGSGNIMNDQKRSEGLKGLINKLFRESVETENVDSLIKILNWFRDVICKMPKLQSLVKEWNGDFDNISSGSEIQAIKKYSHG